MARPPLAIYIHWPFCRSKCPYCDFNSHVRERIDVDSWTSALLADLDRQAELAPGHEVASIFFGGGTPSLMPPETAAALIERVKQHWPAARKLEITLEANPNSAESRRFAAFAAAGINRLSLGVQALDPAALKFLGRGHDRTEAVAAITMSQKLFPRTSFDLIYARPGQSLAAWADELDEALAFAGEHLSLYQLTIELGPGAHGRITRGGVKYATRQRRLPEAWLRRPEFEEMTAIRRESAVEEMVMMGLRLVEGVPRVRLEAVGDCTVEALFGAGLRRLIEGGFVALDERRLTATAAGRQRLNAVLAALFG